MYETTPQIIGEDAAAVDLTPWAVPASWAHARAVDPGWDLRPQERDGLFFGLSMPVEVGLPLRYIATDSQGTILWTAERPPACTGFVVSRAAEVPIAVLTDVDSSGATTVTAYDLESGQRRWGPLAVLGAHQGPGLVFAAPAEALGATGPRVALDPATGAVVADEAEHTGLTVVGEFDGVVLTSQDGMLNGVDAESGQQRWSIPTTEVGIAGGGAPVALPGAEAPPGTALLVGAAGAGPVGALIQTDDGTVLTTDARQAVLDPVTGVHVVLGATTLRALRGTEELWSIEDTTTTTVASAGGVLVYLRAGDSLSVRNVLTGAEAVAYEGDPIAGYAVPSLVSTSGAAVVRTDGYLLLTVTGPGMDPSP